LKRRRNHRLNEGLQVVSRENSKHDGSRVLVGYQATLSRGTRPFPRARASERASERANCGRTDGRRRTRCAERVLTGRAIGRVASTRPPIERGPSSRVAGE
jgi:hypothetical protein